MNHCTASDFLFKQCLCWLRHTKQTNNQRLERAAHMLVLWNQNRNTFPSSPPVPSDPWNEPFPRACHVCLNNSVTVSLKANPRCAVFFFLTPSQTCFRGSNKSYSLAKCLKCILSHERENPILSLQCEISDVFLLVRSAVLLIHTLCCWHKTNMVGFWILEEVRRYPRSDSSWYFVNFIFFNTSSQDTFLKQTHGLK